MRYGLIDMTQDEFMRLWNYLRSEYPFSIRDDVQKLWAVEMKTLNIKTVARALDTYKRSGQKDMPTPKEIRESVEKYKGCPDLLYKAVMRIKKEREAKKDEGNEMEL